MTTYGTQRGRLVPCSRSPHHPFHPESEQCDWCEPVVKTFTPARKYGREYRHWYYNGAPGPAWEEITSQARDDWDEDADAHIRTALAYTGVLPEWHPDYLEDGPTLPAFNFYP